MNGLAKADYAVIIGFFVVMVVIGMYFHRKMRNMGDYFGGGKRVPWWLAGISFYMCSFSALGFVIYSELAYKYGWTAVTLFWVTVPAVFLGAQLFAQRWRRISETSPLEFIEHRFGNHMRQGLVWLRLPHRILDDGLKLFAIGTVISVGMGFPFKWAVIASGVIMVSYTFMGGLWATLVADFIQFVVLFGAVIVLPFLVFKRIDGGFSGFIEQAPAGFFRPLSADHSLFFLLIWFLIIFLNYSTSWALVQRYYSADSDKSARKVGYLMTFLSFISPPIFFIPAMAARVFIPGIENTKDVYPIICKTVLPVGMLGMVIAAMFAATMSMVAGDFNAASSVLTNDVYKSLINRKASSRVLLLIGRVNTLLIGIVVIIVAFMLRAAQGQKDLFDTMVKIGSTFMIPCALPTLLGMLTKRVSKVAGLIGLYCGIVFQQAFCVYLLAACFGLIVAVNVKRSIIFSKRLNFLRLNRLYRMNGKNKPARSPHRSQ